MAIQYFVSKLIEEYRRQAMHAAFSIKDVIYRVLGAILATSLILWLSVFFYASFYYSYMPVVSHTRPVHFTFSACENAAGMCSFPQAVITLTTKRQILMGGQPYKIFLDLEMPESDVNQKLGMFMVNMQLLDINGKPLKTSRKSAMLKYKSFLLQTISTLFFSPFLLAGPMDEKQTVSIEMFPNFEEDASYPVTGVWIEIENKFIQLYSANLRLQAHFVGLRYLMFHFPVVAAIVGITTNAVFLFFVMGCIWYKLFKPNQVVIRVGYPPVAGSRLVRSVTSPTALGPAVATVEPQPGSPNKTLEQRRLEAREKVLRERQKKLSSLNSEQTNGERSRSMSMGSLSRIEEINGVESPALESEYGSFDQEDGGLVMGSFGSRHEEPSPEIHLRHRTVNAPASETCQS